MSPRVKILVRLPLGNENEGRVPGSPELVLRSDYVPDSEGIAGISYCASVFLFDIAFSVWAWLQIRN